MKKCVAVAKSLRATVHVRTAPVQRKHAHGDTGHTSQHQSSEADAVDSVADSDAADVVSAGTGA